MITRHPDWEIRDLLFNPEQTGQLIDECAAIIADPSGAPSMADADRAKWDYHPVMKSEYTRPSKAGQGLFYQISPTKNFAGMVRLMKSYAKSRSEFIDNNLLDDPSIPSLREVTLVCGLRSAGVKAVVRELDEAFQYLFSRPPSFQEAA